MARFDHSSCVAVLALLAGCSDGGGPAVPGGQSGGEGSWVSCRPTEVPLESLDAVHDALGFSAREVLRLMQSQEVALRWHVLDSGPQITPGEQTLTIAVEPGADAPSLVHCADPDYPEARRPLPQLELPVEVSLQTADGLLDERLDGVLIATEASSASIEAIMVEAEDLEGGMAQLVAELFDGYTGGKRTLGFELHFGADGPVGRISGPPDPWIAQVCTAVYATWPAEAECWPDADGAPTDDAVLAPYLDWANRSFELAWKDGSTTDATLEVELAEGPMCGDAEFGDDEFVSHRVRIRVTTGDGRMDLTLPGSLLGGPSTVEPWPEEHRDVEPFSLLLSGAIALETAEVREQFGYSGDDSAVIVSLYVGTSGATDEPLLVGELRAVTLDRTGFATPLPAVPLEGGEDERCFNVGGVRRTAILRGELGLK